MRCLAGEALHFLRDYREAAASISCPGGLNRRIQCEEVGLAGDVADHRQDRFDRAGVRR